MVPKSQRWMEVVPCWSGRRPGSDVTHYTARRLLRVAKGLCEHPELAPSEQQHSPSFDRLVETLRLAESGAPSSVIARSDGFDLAGVRRLAARHRRMRKTDEREVFRDRYVATQTSLDGLTGRFWGELPGFEFRIFEKAIEQRADLFRDLPGPSPAAAARRADALVSISQDSLDGREWDAEGGGASTPLVTVFVDGELAAETTGEAGAEIEFGLRVRPATLERTLCGGSVQIIGLGEGEPMAASHASHAIPPAIRRAALWRDGGCTIDGCRSRYRLEVHHIEHGGKTRDHSLGSLTTLCWFHHHVAIHGEGFELDPSSPPGRRRFLRRAASRAGPP